MLFVHPRGMYKAEAKGADLFQEEKSRSFVIDKAYASFLASRTCRLIFTNEKTRLFFFVVEEEYIKARTGEIGIVIRAEFL